MKVSGFTLVRNGVKFDYPFTESLRSLSPLVDELSVNVGKSEDETLERVQALSSEKLRWFESEWPINNPEKKKGGLILSEQTNLALERCSNDWCIYLQADEVLHEADYDLIKLALKEAESRPEIEGLLFDYVHFYGSFDVVQRTRSAYRREVRAVRKSAGAVSVGDAQSFRKRNGEKLTVLRTGARIFHYGWVRSPEAMREKTFFMDQLYHGVPSPEAAKTGTPHTGDNYRYKRFWGLKKFTGSHPAVMAERIRAKGWHWDLEKSPLVWNWKDAKKVVLDSLEKLTGHRFFEYRSYRMVNARGSWRDDAHPARSDRKRGVSP